MKACMPNFDRSAVARNDSYPAIVIFYNFFLRLYVYSFYYCIVAVVNLFQTNMNECMNE